MRYGALAAALLCLAATPTLAAGPFDTGAHLGAALGFGAGETTGAGSSGATTCDESGTLYPLLGSADLTSVVYGVGGYAQFAGTGLNLIDDGSSMTSTGSTSGTFQPVTSTDGLDAAFIESNHDTACILLHPGTSGLAGQGFVFASAPPADSLAVRGSSDDYYSSGTIEQGLVNTPTTAGPAVATSGLIGSAFAGYDWRLSKIIVAGIEGDVSLAGIAGGATGSRVGTNAMASIRGRVGVTFDRFLVYLTGGLALGNVWSEGGGTVKSALAIGTTGGVGTEYALTEVASLRFEERFVSFQPVSLGGTSVTQSFAQSLIGYSQHF